MPTPATSYENFIIQSMVNDYLATKLDVNKYITVNKELELHDGMVMKVNRYTKSGTAQTVTEGNGNTSAITVSHVPTDYTAVTLQAKFEYSDEDAMTDSYYIDKGVEAVAESIVNAITSSAISEFEDSTNIVYTGATTTAPDFDDFADAIAELNVEDDEEVFFALVNPAMKAKLRKSLKDDMKYCEDFARTGYLGHVCGVPVYTSKAVSDGTVIIANSEAVTCFMKKEAEIEQARVANTRTNDVYGRAVCVVALTDENKCALIKMAVAPSS